MNHENTKERRLPMKLISLAVGIALTGTLLFNDAMAAGSGDSPRGKPFVAIQGEIVEVQGAVTSIQDQIDELVGDVESLEGRILATENAILELADQNLYLQALINGAYTSIDQINAEIEALSQDVETNSDLITTLQSTIVTIQQGQIDLATSLQDQIDNNLTLIGVLEDDIESINDYMAMDQHITEGTCPEGLYVVGHTQDSLACAPVDASGGATVSGYFRYQRSLSYERDVQVYCNLGDIATGGGFNAIQNNQSVRRSTPTGVNGWTVESVGNDRDIQAYVMCLNVSP